MVTAQQFRDGRSRHPLDPVFHHRQKTYVRTGHTTYRFAPLLSQP